MNSTDGSIGSTQSPPGRNEPRGIPCPSWCVVRHGIRTGEEDDLHIGGALLVRQTVIRLCATIDRRTGAVDGPHIMLGHDEYSLHEADALIGALTQLVEQGGEVRAREGP